MSIRGIHRTSTVKGSATPTNAPVYVDSDDDILKVIPAGSGTTEVQVVDASSSQTLTNKTISGAALTGTLSGDPDFTGSPTGTVVSKSVAFVENGSSTSYVGTVPIPAGSQLLDIIFVSTVLWDGTSAGLNIGDDDDDNGFLTTTSVKATDLAVGEQFRLAAHGSISAESGQTLGKEGAYIVNTTGRVGQATSDSSGGWYTTGEQHHCKDYPWCRGRLSGTVFHDCHLHHANGDCSGSNIIRSGAAAPSFTRDKHERSSLQ